MAESEGTAGIDDDSPKGTDVLEGAEELEEDADGDEQAAEAGGRPSHLVGEPCRSFSRARTP